MDTREYYQKIREAKDDIAASQVITVSLKTADGGRAGVMAEVTREVAAQMLVELRVRLATAEEAEAFLASRRDALREIQERAAQQKIQFTVLSPKQLEILKAFPEEQS